MSCTNGADIDLNNFEQWYNTKSQVINSINSGTTDLTLTGIEDQLKKASQCLLSLSGGASEVVNQINTLQRQILEKTGEIEKDKEVIEIAKHRMDYVDDATRPVSNYESWFPLGRPLKPLSMFLLVGFICFFGVLVAFQVFSILGFQVTMQKSAVTNPFVLWITSNMNFGIPFWLTIAALIAVITYYNVR